MDSTAGTGDSNRYDPEANKVFPSKAFLERHRDLKKSRMQFLKGFHSFYEKYISGTAGSKSLLEFGGGPTIYPLISAAKYVDSITFAEYAETNRDEIHLWKDEKDGSKNNDSDASILIFQHFYWQNTEGLPKALKLSVIGTLLCKILKMPSKY